MFKVIENKQTPKLENMTTEETLSFIEGNKDKLKSFLNHVVNYKNAVGLASNQCGEKERFCVCRTNEGYKLFINPIISKTFGETTQEEEGCLSWPDKWILANRYPKIEVEYFDINGNVLSEEYDGFPAQILQHEIDHLNGVEETIVDKDYKTIKREQPKVGRNDPCPCGSGKKHKKCCG